jgi:hypothetical protein
MISLIILDRQADDLIRGVGMHHRKLFSGIHPACQTRMRHVVCVLQTLATGMLGSACSYQHCLHGDFQALMTFTD